MQKKYELTFGDKFLGFTLFGRIQAVALGIWDKFSGFTSFDKYVPTTTPLIK